MRSWLFPKLLWKQKAHPPKLCIHSMTGALARSLSWKRQQEPGLQGFAKQLLHCGRKLRVPGPSPGSQVMENISQHCKSYLPTLGVPLAKLPGTAPTPKNWVCPNLCEEMVLPKAPLGLAEGLQTLPKP